MATQTFGYNAQHAGYLVLLLRKLRQTVESKRIALTNSVCEKLINSFFLSELFYSISIKIKYDVIIYFKIPITYFKTLY